MLNQLIFKFHGISAADPSVVDVSYYLKEEVDIMLKDLQDTIDISSYAKKDYVDELIKNVSVDLTGYATLEDIPDVTEFITAKDISTLASKKDISTFITAKDTSIFLTAKDTSKFITAEVDPVWQSEKANYVTNSSVYANYQKKGSYLLPKDISTFVTNASVYANYQKKGDYALVSQLDNYQPVGNYIESADLDQWKETNKLVNESALEEVEAIAKGRSRGYVFETKDALDASLKDSAFVDTLEKGDNLYIKALNIPDYWWGGEEAFELETLKVDLSEYAKTSSLSDYVSKTDTNLLNVAGTVHFDNVSIGDDESTRFKAYYAERLSSGDNNTPNYLTLNVGNAGYATIQHMRGQSNIVDSYLLLDGTGLYLRYSGEKGVSTTEVDSPTRVVLDSLNWSNYVNADGLSTNLTKTFVTNTSVNTNYAKKTDLTPINEKLDELELYKFPNATIYGTPAINNGQVSAFSATNYLMFPFVVNFLNRSFSIKMCFTTDNLQLSQQNLFDSEYGLAFAVKNRKFVLAIGLSDGTRWSYELNGDYTVLPNTTYYINIEFDANTNNYSISYSLDNLTFILDKSVNGYSPYPKQITIGKALDNVHIFKGIINLNYCSLTIANKVVWTGMDNVGMATRLALDLGNIDSAGELKIKDIVGPIPEMPSLDDYVTSSTLANYLDKENTGTHILKGKLQVGDYTTNITNAYLHIRNVGTSNITGSNVNGACFAVNGDGTASFQHKTYADNGTGAKNAAILRFSNKGIQFAVNSGTGASPTEAMYKELATLEYVQIQLDDKISNINTKLSSNTLVEKGPKMIQIQKIREGNFSYNFYFEHNATYYINGYVNLDFLFHDGNEDNIFFQLTHEGVNNTEPGFTFQYTGPTIDTWDYSNHDYNIYFNVYNPGEQEDIYLYKVLEGESENVTLENYVDELIDNKLGDIKSILETI